MSDVKPEKLGAYLEAIDELEVFLSSFFEKLCTADFDFADAVSWHLLANLMHSTHKRSGYSYEVLLKKLAPALAVFDEREEELDA